MVKAKENARVYISITVDWEGEHLKNLNDLRTLRKQIGGHIPFTHFICPTYFINNSHSSVDKIKDVITEKDEVALHIHPLKKLIRNLPDISFRTEYNFYKSRTSKLDKYAKVNGETKNPFARANISGRGVPITVYNNEEQKIILQKSVEILQKHFPDKNITGFRAGGWLANDSILSNLEILGFQYDSSAVPPALFSQDYDCQSEGNFRDEFHEENGIFTEYILRLWGCKLQTFPFLKNRMFIENLVKKPISLATQPFKIGNITEMPNNGGMSDFAGSSTYSKLVNLANKSVRNTGKDFFINLGFHQEGEPENKLGILGFINQLKETSLEIRFITVQEALKIHQAG